MMLSPDETRRNSLMALNFFVSWLKINWNNVQFDALLKVCVFHDAFTR